jgi:hypothetical protein
MKRIFLASATVITVMAVTFSSCKKEKPDTDTQSAVDNTICEDEFGKAMNTINGSAIKENGIKSMQGIADFQAGGPIITVDSADIADGFPVTMTIDYGTGTTDPVDGKVRSGKIISVFSDHWLTVGSTVKVTLVNFVSGGTSFSCDSMKLIHSAAYAFTNQIFKGRASNSSWSGSALLWEGTRTITQTSGYNTPLNHLDDVYSLTGSANGVNRDGLAYTVNVTSAIIKRASCSWAESGKVDITPEGLAVRTIDYGNGTCDSQATVTINGNTFSFTMN